jgi:multidrug efflux pump subunit AcrA (membrane-fusion protein)
MPNIRSENINEFISSKPSWIVRRGISLFFIIVVALIACTWFIQYPEIVNVNARINATNPPQQIFAKQQGRLIELFKKDGDSVATGDIIGYTESNANHTEVLELISLLAQVKEKINNSSIETIPNYWQQANTAFTHLGEMQAAHQNFIQAFLVFKNYIASGYYVAKKAMLQKDIITAQKLYNNLLEQKKIQQEDFALAKKNYSVNEKMHKENLINDFEMRNQQSQLLNKKMSVPQMSTTIINAEAQQNNIVKEIMDLDKQTIEQKNNFIQALYTYTNTVEEWMAKNCIVATASGIIHFASFIIANQPIEKNKPFCYITNPVNETSSEILISNKAISKVKPNMEVNLKFAAFPYQENGTVRGVIKEIKTIPTDSGFVALVQLPKGLLTNRNKLIPFTYGLTAQGEIFLENKRLLQKILAGLIKK